MSGFVLLYLLLERLFYGQHVMVSMKVIVGAVFLPLSKGCRYPCQVEGL
jgi:hypothetical protein